MDKYGLLSGCEGFDWDEGNILKNWEKHEVDALECEQCFFNQPLFIAEDESHSESEPRFYCLGQTDQGRELFIVVTIRKNLIRVISARDLNRKERKVYRAL